MYRTKNVNGFFRARFFQSHPNMKKTVYASNKSVQPRKRRVVFSVRKRAGGPQLSSNYNYSINVDFLK